MRWIGVVLTANWTISTNLYVDLEFWGGDAVEVGRLLFLVDARRREVLKAWERLFSVISGAFGAQVALGM